MAHQTQIQFYRGAESGLPTLAAGEPGFTTDSFKLFVGDGATNHQIGGGAGSGDVVGPGSSTDNAVVRWDGTGGTDVQNSGVILDDDDNVIAVNHVSGYTTTATAVGTTTLTAASTRIQFFTGTATQDVVLPVVSTLSLGWQFVVVNHSTASIFIKSSGGNAITNVGAGHWKVLTCILTSGTGAASWDRAYAGFDDSTGSGGVVLEEDPTLVGVPAAPTASPGTNTTQIATCAFVIGELASVGRTEGTLAATGSTQGDAAPIVTDAVVVSGADGTTGVILTNTAAKIIAIQNNAGSTLKVYPNLGASISAGGTNTAASLFSNSAATYVRVSSTKWYTITML